MVSANYGNVQGANSEILSLVPFFSLRLLPMN